MTELKTLKDITPVICLCVKQVGIEYEELRKEAIKWVKKFDNNEYTDELVDFADSGYGEYSSSLYGNVQSWIIHFFNITKEELDDIAK